MDQFLNNSGKDTLKCDRNKNQCEVESSVSSDTQKDSEVHSTDLEDRVKRLEFWSEEHKVNVHNKREAETLLLMCLKTCQSDSCIMHLIEIECDVNATNRYGKSPLHLAIKRLTMIVAIELIKRGANINAQDNNKFTPLHYAVMKNHEAVCMLLYYGADVYIKCCNMLSPLSLAFCSKEFDSVQTLMDYHEGEDLYEDINFFIYSYPNALELFVLSNNSDLFKLVWTYINHDGLTEFKEPFLLTYLGDCNFPTNEWFECLQLILQSDSIVELIEHFNNYVLKIQTQTFISLLLYTFYNKQIEINKRTSTIFMVLSLGTEIYLNDFNYVFEFFGFGAELEAFIYAADYNTVYNSELFSFALLPFILALSNDFSTKTIVSLLKKQIMYDHYVNNDTKQNHVASALRSFSFNSNAKAELLEICCKHISNNCQIRKVLSEVPEVPSLLELSRNRLYLSIQGSYKVKKPYHFHDAVNNLLLPQKLKDVIIFKTPIH